MIHGKSPKTQSARPRENWNEWYNLRYALSMAFFDMTESDKAFTIRLSATAMVDGLSPELLESATKLLKYYRPL